MEILVTTLIVPFLGALLLLAEWQSRIAYGRTSRGNWRLVLRGCAIALLPVVAGMVWHALVRLTNESWIYQAIPSIVRLLMIVAAARAAFRAWQIGLMGDYFTAEPAAMLRQTRPRDELRLCAWILTCFPLLWATVPALLLVAPFLFVAALMRMSQRVERTRFLWTLAIAVEHGMDLPAEVEAFGGGARWRTKERYMALAGRLRDGARLSDALATDGLLTSAEIIAAVRVAEQTGSLVATLRAAAARHQTALCNTPGDRSVITLICYCWFVLVVMSAITSSLAYWIAPKFEEIFKDFGVEMPLLTARLFDMSASSVTIFLLIIPLLVVPAGILVLLTTRSVDDTAASAWGPLSRIYPRRDAPGVLRWLALAVAGGRPLSAVISDVAERQPNRGLSLRLQRAAHAMNAGEPPWQALSDEHFLSRREVAAVQAADRAGNAPTALNAIADSIERTHVRRTLLWIEWLRPTVMLVFGGLVGIYCLAYFLPVIALLWHAIRQA
ncbi:MAG: type II secretion system F family protein [Planctomycetaceae bacterium]|nr:type II secretion system F family protein [Planctomycetaceae bacterium]